ncbi:MAG: hypothetical protein K5644_08345 [Lachnospiraceae bacterium]|nr:hypothetical protein [Lachnospiraceae bacterium]
MNNRLQKKDIAYVGALVCFMILCVARFWDRTIEDTNHLFAYMNNMRVAEIITGALFLMIVAFVLVTIKKSDEEVKKSNYYLLVLFTALIVPMYLCDEYFGTGDVYSWILILFAVIISITSDYDMLSMILVLAAEAFCPAHNLAGTFAIFILILYKGLVKGKKSESVLLIVGAILYIAEFFLLFFNGYFSGVNVHRISLLKCIASLILLSPIIIYVLRFILKLIKGSNSEGKMFYTGVFLGGTANFVFLLLMNDYCRAIVLTTVYFVVVCIALLVIDEDFKMHYIEEREIVRKYIPVPVAIIIYIFAIVTYWFFAMDYIEPDELIPFDLNKVM